jgi:hypothetical protein
MEATPDCSSKCSCRVFEFLESSIGKKIMVALTGLLLCGFLITHLAGNLFLFVGLVNPRTSASTRSSSSARAWPAPRPRPRSPSSATR